MGRKRDRDTPPGRRLKTSHALGGNSHSLTIPREDWSAPLAPTASVVPSGENAMVSTDPPCPRSIATLRPLLTSDSLTVPSKEPVASVVPSGENTIDQTPILRSVETCCPVPAFQSLSVPSLNVAASLIPSGENAIAVIHSVCPLRVATYSLVETSHNSTVPSVPPKRSVLADTRILPSGE